MKTEVSGGGITVREALKRACVEPRDLSIPLVARDSLAKGSELTRFNDAFNTMTLGA